MRLQRNLQEYRQVLRVQLQRYSTTIRTFSRSGGEVLETKTIGKGPVKSLLNLLFGLEGLLARRGMESSVLGM